MTKPVAYEVPDSIPRNEKKNRDSGNGQQEPLSGSKKTKQSNHVSHLNPEG